jgi:protein-S-isoprenylcysteine O-methyltransferase Ste14
MNVEGDDMPDNVLKVIFLSGLIASQVLRALQRRRNRQPAGQRRSVNERVTALDAAVDLLAFAGMKIVPLVYVLTPWLDFADYQASTWAGWLGTVFLVAGLWLLWRSQRDRGPNESSTPQNAREYHLVTQGVYRYMRHPLYAAMWLWGGIAQALLLHNWIVGLAGLALFLPAYLYRAPREERMMLERFGEEYRAYMNRTGRVIPHFSPQIQSA